MTLSLCDRDFWLRYVKGNKSELPMGIRTAGHHRFVVSFGETEKPVKSMLSIFEVALLHALARDYYEGAGEIVDLGPLLGLSTQALARGLSNNQSVSEKTDRIHSYDLFLAAGYSHFLDPVHHRDGGTLFPMYMDLNRQQLDMIRVYPGNLLAMRWHGAPIEILFIDIAKSWDLNDHVIRQFFPALIPGRSIVVQQDYIHFNEYWIHLVMERFADHFELLHMMYGGTAVYQYTRSIPEDALKVSLRDLPIAEKSVLLERARAKAPRSVQEVMKLAHAKCLHEFGETGQAIKMWRSVDHNIACDDPILPIGGILRDNRRKVAQLLSLTSEC